MAKSRRTKETTHSTNSSRSRRSSDTEESTTSSRPKRGSLRALATTGTLALGLLVAGLGLKGHLGTWLAGQWQEQLEAAPESRVISLARQIGQLGGGAGTESLVDSLGSERPEVSAAAGQVLSEQLDCWCRSDDPQHTHQVLALAEALAEKIGEASDVDKQTGDRGANLAARILQAPRLGTADEQARVVACCQRVLESVSAKARQAAEEGSLGLRGAFNVEGVVLVDPSEARLGETLPPSRQASSVDTGPAESPSSRPVLPDSGPHQFVTPQPAFSDDGPLESPSSQPLFPNNGPIESHVPVPPSRVIVPDPTDKLVPLRPFPPPRASSDVQGRQSPGLQVTPTSAPLSSGSTQVGEASRIGTQIEGYDSRPNLPPPVFAQSSLDWGPSAAEPSAQASSPLFTGTGGGIIATPATAPPTGLSRPETIDLIRQLRSSDSGVAAAARAELMRLGMDDVHLDVARRLVDPDPVVRKDLATRLPELQSVDPVPWLMHLVQDPDPEVRRVASGFLATVQDPAVLRRLESLGQGMPGP